MGWSVEVAEFDAYEAVCVEFGCEFKGELTLDRAQAEREAAQHRLHHEQVWQAQNAAWEAQRNADPLPLRGEVPDEELPTVGDWLDAGAPMREVPVGGAPAARQDGDNGEGDEPGPPSR